MAKIKAKKSAGTTAKDDSETGPNATRAGLYARAQEAGILGRSRMNKNQLQHALGRVG